MAKNEHWYLHVDLDAFFASVEQLDHPEYRGKPLIVGGKPEDRRSVVSTASYEARKYGVHSAMPTYQAYKLCPHAIFVYGRMERYAELSYQIMNIFRNYSPDVDQMSIDEAFIDITGTEKLFGPPLEVAKKIKAEVKQFTGLTVSVGIAPTKYIAKIASGYQKPDGITFIRQGEESSFMLSLPLTKIWGLGPKSQELLRSKGIKKTRDIYEMPLETLVFLFGQNMGNYLYDVVRGNEKATFTRETKNHSISAESTYPYDLTDIYAIETELLQLAHGVFFRLLKENGYSRTAFVKIRYDDFSTCSAQVTLERNIVTLDTYYETLRSLFERKYEKGRGIRLLGVGFENIENEEKPYQQDLFGNKDEKKQAVEKAILNLEKKHPEIKVRKARTFKGMKSLLFFIFFNLLMTDINVLSKIHAQDFQNNTTQQGAGTVLPDVFFEPNTTMTDISDAQENSTQTHLPPMTDISVPETDSSSQTENKNLFEYDISGYYKAEFTTGLISSFGNDTSSVISSTPPVFLQEVELSTSALYNSHWFFNVDFADKFQKNTFAMGYKDGNYLKEAKISNRNIIFPKGYASDFFGFSHNGGQNEAPGISLNFSSPYDKWNVDFMIRYDMSETHSQTFYGQNKVTDIELSPEKFMYGLSFTFPEKSQNALTNIKNIYVADINGNYKDKYGKKYKQLSVTQYTVLPTQSKIIISQTANSTKKNGKIPTILITFYSPTTATSVITDTGNYDDENSFAGQIQSIFANKYSLQKYSYNLLSEIENSPALVIQNSTGFSPYLNTNIYDCGLSANNSSVSNEDLLVTSKTSSTIYKEFQINTWQDSYNTVQEDFLYENHYYAQVINTKSTPMSVISGENFYNSNSSIPSRYPFADISPEIYLNIPQESDITILKRTYSPVKEINIGTNLNAFSVQVYVNGVLDHNASYNAETGSVALSSPITNTDKIYITWQEESKDYTNGAFSAVLGLKYNWLPELTTDISLSTYLPLTSFATTNNAPQKALSIENLKPSYVALATGIDFQKDTFTLSNKSALSVIKENASNLLLVSSIDDNAISQPQTINSTPSLSWNFTNVDFSSPEEVSNASQSVDIKLSEGSLLKNSSSIEFTLKTNIEHSSFDFYDFYLLLGINADSDYVSEDKNLLPTWKLNLQNQKNTWQKVKVDLSDEQRAKLISYHDARFIVKLKDGLHIQPTQLSGVLYFDTYKLYQKSIHAEHSENVSTTMSVIPYNSKTFTTTQYASFVKWNVTSDFNEATTTKENSTLKLKRFFSQADFTNYETLNFDFCMDISPQNNDDSSKPSFSLILKNTDDIALELTLHNIQKYINSVLSFHTLTLNINTKEVYIDNELLNASEYSLHINNEIAPHTQEIHIPLTNIASLTYENDSTFKNINKTGTFYIGNLYYKNSKVSVSAQNFISADYEKQFQNVKIQTSLSSLQSTGDFNSPDFTASSTAKTSIDTKYAIFKTDVSLQNLSLSNAGHTLKSSSPLLKVISFTEDYRYSVTDKSLSKSNDFSLDFSRLNIPLKLSLKTNAEHNFINENQQATFETSYSLQQNTWGLNLLLNANYSQKINTLQNDNNTIGDSYFSSWKDITLFSFSNGKENASKRNEEYSAKLSGNIFENKLSPSLTYNLQGSYCSFIQTKYLDSQQINFALPISFFNNTLSFTHTRIASGETLFSTTSYLSDTKHLFETQKERSYLYTSIPFYELFDSTLPQNVTQNFSAKYEILYQRPLFNNIKDVYIPSSASFAVIRDIKSLDNTKDLYQYKTVITNTSLNNFGFDSLNQFFKWFKQEEIISSITGIVKVPTDSLEQTTYLVSGYLQSLFYINDNATLTTALDASFETDNTWSTHETFIYNRKSNVSFIKSFAQFLIPYLQSIDFTISRKDILNIQLSKNDNKLKQNYAIEHSVDHKFLKNYCVSTGLGGTFSYVEDLANNLEIHIKLGFSAEF